MVFIFQCYHAIRLLYALVFFAKSKLLSGFSEVIHRFFTPLLFILI